MQVNYCDLCGAPLKESAYFMLYISEPRSTNTYSSDNDEILFNNYIKQVQKSVKEVCPTCKQIFDKMFELRLQRLSELATEINCIYNLPIQKEKKEKKRGKEKK